MNPFALFRMKTFAALIGVGVLALAACTNSLPTLTATQAPSTPTATVQPTATSIPIQVGASGIQGGDPNFDFTTMTWQAYWLSRDHFGPFVMASGMGLPFMPDMDIMQKAMQMVAQNPNDPVMLPLNMMPLQAVFASGSSDLLNDPRDFDPLDFEGLRLDPSTFDETVTVRGQAETMRKESQWARNFANPYYGTPTGDFGAQQRFMGVMVNMLAQMQAQYAMKNLMGEDGLYADSNGSLDYTGNWVMLHALSDIAGLAGDMNGPYMNPDMYPMFDNAASMLFQALENRVPDSSQESASAIRALTYLAWTATEDEVKSAALAKASTIADSQLQTTESNDVVDNAAAIVGLVTASIIDGNVEYLEAADALFQTLKDDFDATYGVFNSKSTYSADDVAWILGGLNSLILKGNSATQEPAKAMQMAFYESTISLAGMQLSAPPGKNGAMASEWEKNLPSVLYYHPADTPPPPMVGKLTIPAEEITWDGTSWSVTSDRFVTAGAMHLANELNWFGPVLGSIPFAPLAGS